MRIFRKILTTEDKNVPDATLTLPYERRCRSRQRVRLDNGDEAGLLLPRGTVLQHGDLLATEDGFTAVVEAAPENLTRAWCDDSLLLARACYHLGNRHVAVQIEHGGLRYLHDDVLDEMLRRLGLVILHENSPFHPEPGAYHDHGHSG